MSAAALAPGPAVAIRRCVVCHTEIRSKGLVKCSRHFQQELGISYRQLDFWVRNGWLRPAHTGTSGTGRDWPPCEVEIARRMARLVAAGFTPDAAHRIARESWPSGEIAPGITLTATTEEPS